MTDSLIDAASAANPVPIHLLDADRLGKMTSGLDDRTRAWIDAAGFTAKSGSCLLVPDAEGGLDRVLFGLEDSAGGLDPMAAGALPDKVPPGDYCFAEPGDETALAAIYFALGTYRFSRYREPKPDTVRLVLPGDQDGGEIRATVAAVTLVRDLVNTPANDLGPAELSAAVRDLGAGHGAAVTEISGAELESGFPMVHAVGRAATAERAPRLVDLTWGDPDHPKITLVGKGVCFDSGGLDIKPSSAMLNMKKDMGGAANTMGLAHMIMATGLKVRLRLLVPTVENAIGSASFRPGDILISRNKVSVEIGNTDAEGRLILADALTYAFEEEPSLVIDMATLTGAARVALGPDVPAVFSGSDALAGDLVTHGEQVRDPVWRLPLYRPYMSMIETKTADINNAGTGGFAGAITAALFLARFVDPERWIHTDLFAWNPTARPGRPVGGEAQSIRAFYRLIRGLAAG